MADQVFNVGLGRVVEWARRVDGNDPVNSAFHIEVLATAGIESDAVLKDKTDLADLVAGATNIVTNGGYADQQITASITFGPDQSNDRADVDFPDVTFAAIAAGDGWNDFIVCYDSDTTGGTDANIELATMHDFVVTPDGSDITAQLNTAGFFRAS